jgi:hypothetical protein
MIDLIHAEAVCGGRNQNPVLLAAFDAWCNEHVQALIDELRDLREVVEKCRELYYATIGNHSLHWDHTGQHGAGCDQCHKERAARDKIAEALGAIETLKHSEPTPPNRNWREYE